MPNNKVDISIKRNDFIAVDLKDRNKNSKRKILFLSEDLKVSKLHDNDGFKSPYFIAFYVKENDSKKIKKILKTCLKEVEEVEEVKEVKEVKENKELEEKVLKELSGKLSSHPELENFKIYLNHEKAKEHYGDSGNFKEPVSQEQETAVNPSFSHDQGVETLKSEEASDQLQQTVSKHREELNDDLHGQKPIEVTAVKEAYEQETKKFPESLETDPVSAPHVGLMMNGFEKTVEERGSSTTNKLPVLLRPEMTHSGIAVNDSSFSKQCKEQVLPNLEKTILEIRGKIEKLKKEGDHGDQIAEKKGKYLKEINEKLVELRSELKSNNDTELENKVDAINKSIEARRETLATHRSKNGSAFLLAMLSIFGIRKENYVQSLQIINRVEKNLTQLNSALRISVQK